jgi:hypothetical protein
MFHTSIRSFQVGFFKKLPKHSFLNPVFRSGKSFAIRSGLSNLLDLPPAENNFFKNYNLVETVNNAWYICSSHYMASKLRLRWYYITLAHFYTIHFFSQIKRRPPQYQVNPSVRIQKCISTDRKF